MPDTRTLAASARTKLTVDEQSALVTEVYGLIRADAIREVLELLKDAGEERAVAVVADLFYRDVSTVDPRVVAEAE